LPGVLVLEVVDLHKAYDTPHGPLAILTGAALSLAPGDSASIMGASGSGKSTLLYIVGGLDRPTSGRVTLDGVNPHTLAPNDLATFRNKSIGFVFQDHCLLPQCSVLENVLAPTIVTGTTAEDIARAKDLVARVGLQARETHRPAALSGGEKQRVAIARALIRKPRLLLCDEPTGNLDKRSADTASSLLFELHAQLGTILLLVTHNPDLARQCGQQYELVDGHLHRTAAAAMAPSR
jgi:lipoprotein-releasing system ATP-binding protein